MNATNPFQIPTWAQISREQRRRERFKRTVIFSVAAGVLLLVGLLIEGCKTERDTMSTAVTPSTTVSSTAVPSTIVAPQVQASVVPAIPPPHPASKVSPVTDTRHSMTVYVVKSGDTLSRIAKAHGTTVKAIETANGLSSDRILIGAKLKIPEA